MQTFRKNVEDMSSTFLLKYFENGPGTYVLPHSDAGDAFFTQKPQLGHFPDNTIHWPNAEVMMGHRLRRSANIIATKTL